MNRTTPLDSRRRSRWASFADRHPCRSRVTIRAFRLYSSISSFCQDLWWQRMLSAFLRSRRVSSGHQENSLRAARRSAAAWSREAPRNHLQASTSPPTSRYPARLAATARRNVLTGWSPPAGKWGIAIRRETLVSMRNLESCWFAPASTTPESQSPAYNPGTGSSRKVTQGRSQVANLRWHPSVGSTLQPISGE